MNQIYEKLFLALTRENLYYLNETVSDILRNPFVVCDTNYKILAQYPDHKIGDDFFDQMYDKKTLDIKMLETIQADNYQEALDENNHMVYLDYGIAKTIPRYIASIITGTKVIGFIAVLESETPFSEHTKETIRLITQAYALYMCRVPKYYPSGETYTQYISQSIFKDRKINDTQLSYLKNHFASSNAFRICFTDITSHRNRIVLLSKLKKYLDTYTAAVSCIIEDVLYILYPDSEKNDPSFALIWNTVLKQAGIYNLKFGISNSFRSFLQIPLYKSQAQHAFSHCDATLCFFQEILMEDYADALRKNTDSSIYYHPALLRLKEYDSSCHTELYHTLKTYIMSMNDSAYTTHALNIHRNTLLYRLDKIEQLCSLDLNDKKLCNQLFLNFCL